MTKLIDRLSHLTRRRLDMRAFDIAAQHIDRYDIVAKFKAKPLGDFFLEGNQRRTVIILSATILPCVSSEPFGISVRKRSEPRSPRNTHSDPACGLDRF